MIPENKLHKLCLIYGNQQLLVKEAVDSIIEERLKGQKYEWSLERFNAHDLIKTSGEFGTKNLEDLLISCETFPMFTDRKVIQIDNFDLVKKSRNNFEKNTQYSLFETIDKIIHKPPESIWFVFTSKASREQDFSKPLYQIIKKTGLIKKFTAYENDTPLNWVIQRGDTMGLPLSADAARLLINIVGSDLMDLDHELEKLSLYLSGEKCTEEIIKKHIRGHKHFSVFRMTDALSRKELLPALEILDQQLQMSPREHVRLFSIIVMQFRRLINIHSMLEKLYKDSEIIKKISLPEFVGKQLLTQARNFTSLEIQNIYKELAELDLRIKYQSSLAHLILQDLFQKICSGHFKKKII